MTFARTLPGADQIEAGLADLRRGQETITLYARLHETGADSAHARYNALVRRLVSFERALACAR